MNSEFYRNLCHLLISTRLFSWVAIERAGQMVAWAPPETLELRQKTEQYILTGDVTLYYYSEHDTDSTAWQYWLRQLVRRTEDEKHVSDVWDTFPDTVLYVDETGKVLSIPVEQHLPNHPDTYILQPLEQLMGIDTAHALRPLIRRAIKTGDIQSLEYQQMQTNHYMEARVVRKNRHMALLLLRNITHTKIQQERQQFVHLYDQLTGLMNRYTFRERVEHMLQDPSTQHLALILCDLDQFKELNDTYGYSSGDDMLQQSAQRLSYLQRHDDALGRLSADQFVIAVKLQNPQELPTLALSIRRAFQEPFQLSERTHTTHIRLGAALYPQDAKRYGDLLKSAELALQHAKEQRSFQEFYRTELDAENRKRIEILKLLRETIQTRAFVRQYQPLWDARANKIWGVEALIRMHSNEQKVSPVDFIPIAENNGLIRHIDQQMIEEALQDLKQDAFLVSINLSPRTMRDSEFFSWLFRFVDSLADTAERLQVEITESSLLQDREKAVMRLQELRDMGVRVALDDFGVGYSSMSYLKHLPVDVLKLDSSFVQGLGKNTRDAKLMQNLISLGHGLDLTVLAEGVETREQYDWLVEAGCDLIQGYYIAKPMSSENLHQWLSESNK